MAKKLKTIIIIMFFVVLISSFSLLAQQDSLKTPDNIDNHAYIEHNLLSSSRFTSKEVKDEVKYQDYLDNYTLNYSEDELNDLGYLKYGETDQLILYFEPISFSLMIKNKLTSYLWSSNAEFLSENENRDEYKTGIWVDYVLANNITRNYTTKNLLAEKAKVTHSKIANKQGFTSSIYFDALGFKFNVLVYLEDGELVVELPNASIEELLPRYRIINLHLFPYLGSARLDNYPGYLFIPDGIGALVRFNEEVQGNYYLANFYGSDFGYTSNYLNRYSLTLPIWGIVHDVGENAFLGTIESGSTISDLGAYFTGYRSSNYYRMAPIFKFREFYTNVIDKSENGSETIPESINKVDVKLRYLFLSDEKADYVGMATTYKNHLEKNNIIDKVTSNGDIPLAIDFLMSELEPSFFGQKSVQMTKPNDALDIYNEFKNNDIKNLVINIMGWSKSGIYDTSPYSVSYSASKPDYLDLINSVSEDENDIYFFVNYINTSSLAKRPRNSDLARRMSKVKMSVLQDTNFLYPESSLKFATSDKKTFEDLGIENLHFNNLANTLFSYYHNNERFNRETSVEYYKKIAKLYPNSVYSRPNYYMLEFATKYFNMPLYNSQHNYFSDLVPFLPILLKGNIEYFSPYLNFNSIGKEQILNLIDFGMNPNFIITKEDTTKLLYTKADMFYSTKYSNYKDKIIDQYQYINNALKHVSSESIVNRKVIESGIVEVEYSNGIIIYINYSSTNFKHKDITINAKDYYVYEE